MYKTIILIILFLGLLSIAVETVRTYNTQPKTRIEYRYIPRTYDEELTEPVYASEIFETMFSQPSPWLLSVREYDQRKQENINKYFISQL